MAKVIKYQGIIQNWSELSITGKPATWRISQQEEREEAEAVLLLNTRLFTEIVAANRLAGVGKMSGNFGAVGSKVNCSLPWGYTGTFQWTRTLKEAPFTKTAIAGATASAVNGLDYTLITGDTTLYNIDCDITAIVQKVAGGQTSAPTTVAPVTPVAPTVLANPVINGTATVGVSVTATAGSYSGTPTPSVVRQWLVAGSVVATASSYTPVSSDATKALTVRETATNDGGNVVANSAAVTIAAAAVTTPGAPTITASPASATSVTVNITAGSGDAPTGYTVTSSPAGGVDSAAGTTTSPRTITGLTTGTSYTFTATATNGSATSPASAPSNSATPMAAKKVTAASMRYVENSNYTAQATGVSTTHEKRELETTNITGVRLWVGTKDITGTVPPVFSAVIGRTDTMASTNAALTYQPQDAGVAYNAAVDANGRGWAPVTWGGASSATGAYSTAADKDAGLALLKSDVMPFTPSSRTDVPGARPGIVIRIAQTAATASYSVLNMTLGAYGATAAQAETYFRNWFQNKTTNDGVSTLANAATGVGYASGSGYGLFFWPEFTYSIPSEMLLIVGDSRFGNAGALYTNHPWAGNAIMRYSTPAKPCQFANFAGSSRTSTQFFKMATDALSAGLTPSMVVFPCFSPNDSITNTTIGQAAADRAAAFLATLQALPTPPRIFISTGYGATYNGAAEAGRQVCVSWAKAQSAPNITILDTDAALTDYTTVVGTAGIKAEYKGDNIHANAAGNEVQLNMLYNAIGYV